MGEHSGRNGLFIRVIGSAKRKNVTGDAGQAGRDPHVERGASSLDIPCISGLKFGSSV